MTTTITVTGTQLRQVVPHDRFDETPFQIDGVTYRRAGGRDEYRDGGWQVTVERADAPANPATAAQINYLRDLIRRDPGAASNAGLSLHSDLTALDKHTASHAIDVILYA